MEEPKNIQEILNWLTENIGLLPTVIVVFITLGCIIWRYSHKKGGKENIVANQNSNTGGIQAGQINGPVYYTNADLKQSKKEEEKQWFGSSDPVTEGVEALKALPMYMRRACIAEACGFVTMPDGSCPYTGKEGHIKYAGVEYIYRELKWDALLKVGKNEALSCFKLLDDRRENKEIHENWVRAQFYLQTYKNEILDYFEKDVEEIRGREAKKNS